jgi:ubiquinone biosynthesis protein
MIPTRVIYPIKWLYNPNSTTQAIALKKFLNSTPLLIKLGQLLATRIDLFSTTFIEQLKTLNDNTKNEDINFLKKIFYKEFNQDVQQIFQDISQNSVASASVAKVYKAKLNNQNVAIKVLNPKIKKYMKLDIALLKILFKFLELFSATAKISKPTKIINYLENQIKFELDLRFEGASADQLREHFKTDKDIYIPKIYWDYTGKDIIVEEWIDGIKIDDKNSLLQNNIDLNDVTKKLAKIFFLQTLHNGFFHGDIHSGNTFVLKTGQICFIDFGIMGHLNNKLKFYVKEVFVAFLNKDYNKASTIHFEAGWVKEPHKIEEFSLACRSIVEKIFHLPQNQIQIGKLLEQLFLISKMFDMEIQQDLLLLQKNLVYLENTGRILCPNDNMWIMSKDIITQNIKNDILTPHYYKYKASNTFNNLKKELIKGINYYAKPKSYHILIHIFNYCLIFVLLYIVYTK